MEEAVADQGMSCAIKQSEAVAEQVMSDPLFASIRRNACEHVKNGRFVEVSAELCVNRTEMHNASLQDYHVPISLVHPCGVLFIAALPWRFYFFHFPNRHNDHPLPPSPLSPRL